MVRRRSKRILYVGIPECVHAARWTGLVADAGWDVHFFPAHLARLHSGFSPRVACHDRWRSHAESFAEFLRTEFIYPAHIRGLWRLRCAAVRFYGAVVRSRAKRLAGVIDDIGPDIIHSLMIQPAGYLTLEALPLVKGRKPKWIVQNWGNDIQFFGPLKNHRENIKQVLARCDYYDCECERDVGLARQYGFSGKVLNVLPVSGGYDVERYQAMRHPGKTSVRRVIAVKGYEGIFGRAFTALRAIELAADVLKGYSIEVYLPRNGVPEAAELLSLRTGIPITVIPPSPHEEIMRLHGRARVSIGVSMSDGISQSLLEAMVMGSFPIQSNTAAADEWVTDGKTGFVVPPEDAQAISTAIRRAVSDDGLVDRAAEENLLTVRSRLDLSVTTPRILSGYRVACGLAADGG